jgi:hypothetical protein
MTDGRVPSEPEVGRGPAAHALCARRGGSRTARRLCEVMVDGSIIATDRGPRPPRPTKEPRSRARCALALKRRFLRGRAEWSSQTAAA